MFSSKGMGKMLFDQLQSIQSGIADWQRSQASFSTTGGKRCQHSKNQSIIVDFFRVPSWTTQILSGQGESWFMERLLSGCFQECAPRRKTGCPAPPSKIDKTCGAQCIMCCLSSWVPLYTKMPCVVYRGIEAFEAFSTRLLCIIYRISVNYTAPYLAQNWKHRHRRNVTSHHSLSLLWQFQLL